MFCCFLFLMFSGAVSVAILIEQKEEEDSPDATCTQRTDIFYKVIQLVLVTVLSVQFLIPPKNSIDILGSSSTADPDCDYKSWSFGQSEEVRATQNTLLSSSSRLAILSVTAYILSIHNLIDWRCFPMLYALGCIGFGGNLISTRILLYHALSLILYLTGEKNRPEMFCSGVYMVSMVYLSSYFFNDDNIRQCPKNKRYALCRNYFQYPYWILGASITALCRMQMFIFMKIEMHSVVVEVAVFTISCGMVVHGCVITHNPISCLPVTDYLATTILYVMRILLVTLYMVKCDFSEHTNIISMILHHTQYLCNYLNLLHLLHIAIVGKRVVTDEETWNKLFNYHKITDPEELAWDIGEVEDFKMGRIEQLDKDWNKQPTKKVINYYDTAGDSMLYR